MSRVTEPSWDISRSPPSARRNVNGAARERGVTENARASERERVGNFLGTFGEDRNARANCHSRRVYDMITPRRVDQSVNCRVPQSNRHGKLRQGRRNRVRLGNLKNGRVHARPARTCVFTRGQTSAAAHAHAIGCGVTLRIESISVRVRAPRG